MYYVYLLYWDSEPLRRYVGKGQEYSYLPQRDYRAHQSMRRLKADRYRIVYWSTSERDALWMEDYLYVNLKKRGYLMANLVRPNRHEVSPETREKISKANKGRIRSAEVRARISATLTGRKRSEEAKRKTSETLKGRKFTEEHKSRISQARRSGEVAKLNPDKVREIRQLMKTGASRSNVAKMFSVSASMIDHVRYKRTWADVPD